MKSYKIEVGAHKLGKLILAENKENQYSGYISYTFFEGKPGFRKGFLARLFENKQEKKVNDSIVVKNKLSDSLAKILILKLRKAGIDELMPCKDDDECARINFLDPEFTTFVLTADGKSNYFEYASIGYPISKFPEKTQLRRKVQHLVGICISEIDYSKEFKMAQEHLSKGNYFMPSSQGYLTFKR
ncbi:MAG: hypothetical protein EOO07_14400 [Chitinophagaceae bacterium]|nr:MAG: hypothetical protein EOO07_14400 [Chitinophagaceae bacterium]